jgi:hypothetical protein
MHVKIKYGLDDPGILIRFPAEATELSLLHIVQTGSGAHPMGPGEPFPWGREADHSPPSSAEVAIRLTTLRRWVYQALESQACSLVPFT